MILQNLEELLLKATNAKDYSTHLNVVLDFYTDDVNKNILSTQLEIFRSNFLKSEEMESVCLIDVDQKSKNIL